MPKQTTNKPQMAPISRVLDKKPGGEDEILFPTPTPFEWNGKTYKIKPLSNKTLKGLAGEFDKVIGLLANAAETMNANRDPDAEPLEITPAALLPHLPKLLEILLPNATSIIADSLRVDEAEVEDGMFLGKQLEALRLIIEANDFPLLFANFKSLLSSFSPAKATTAEMNAEADDEETEADQEPTDD